MQSRICAEFLSEAFEVDLADVIPNAGSACGHVGGDGVVDDAVEGFDDVGDVCVLAVVVEALVDDVARCG